MLHHLLVGIVDDEKAIRAEVARMVEESAKKLGIGLLKIEEFASAEAFLFRFAENGGFSVLFLDIEMGGMNGIELAKTIRKENKDLQIVFVTGHSTYLPEGYEVDALHYLMKPVSRQKIQDVLEKALNRIEHQESVLPFKSDGTMRLIKLSEIRYISVFSNYVTIHADQEYTSKQTLSELESRLDKRFCRIGRSAIVNIQHVKSSSKSDVELLDGTVLPLPRGAYEQLSRAIIAFF